MIKELLLSIPLLFSVSTNQIPDIPPNVVNYQEVWYINSGVYPAYSPAGSSVSVAYHFDLNNYDAKAYLQTDSLTPAPVFVKISDLTINYTGSRNIIAYVENQDGKYMQNIYMYDSCEFLFYDENTEDELTFSLNNSYFRYLGFNFDTSTVFSTSSTYRMSLKDCLTTRTSALMVTPSQGGSYNEGYSDGYDYGYAVGETVGYDKGIADGVQIESPLQALISAVNSFLNIEIIPGIKLYFPILISLGISLLFVLLKIALGG